jgi:hypothetical protein
MGTLNQQEGIYGPWLINIPLRPDLLHAGCNKDSWHLLGGMDFQLLLLKFYCSKGSFVRLDTLLIIFPTLANIAPIRKIKFIERKFLRIRYYINPKNRFIQ